MAKILYLIAQNNFRDEEYFEPREIFQRAGHLVATASVEAKTCHGMLGRTVVANFAIGDVKPQLFDALVIAGGSGARDLAKNPVVLSVVSSFDTIGKPIAAICLAPEILAKAGVLKGKKATVFHDSLNSDSINTLKANGAKFLPDPIVRDGRILTAKGPQFAKHFGEEFLKLI